MHLFDVLDQYARRKLIGKTERTELKFRRTIRLLGEVVGHLPTTADLTDDNVAAVMSRKAREGSSPATVNDARAKLVALWTFAARRRLVDTFPDIDRINEPSAAPVAWSADQLGRVFAACDSVSAPMCGVPGAIWWRAMVSVLWDTGERVGAILRTPREALTGDSLRVSAETRKAKTRDKVYTLHADTVGLLDLVRRHSGSPGLLPIDCCYDTVLNRYRRMLKRAGLPHDRKHLFHCIRRSVASHAAAAGADATAILDHADPSITRRYYLDPRIVPHPQAVDVLFRPQKSA